MAKEYGPQWETVSSADGEWTYRLKVPGGWLYRFNQQTVDHHYFCCMSFVPIPQFTDEEIEKRQAIRKQYEGVHGN